MHMADALVSPVVGGTMWLVACGLIGHSVRRIEASAKDHLVPLMGVLGAFVFTAQMINFTIPGTGSSGHLGGGLLLAALLGPHAALLVIASVLTVQALFFADGGLLALGCNIVNLGFFPAYVAYPWVYRVIVRGRYGAMRGSVAALAASVLGLQLGALSVVLQTQASGIAELPFGPFAALMLPIHLAIGVVEGCVTAAVVAFVARARPEVLPVADVEPVRSLRPVLAALLIAAALTGGLLSGWASSLPDGLEWAIARLSGTEEVSALRGTWHARLSAVQERTAVMPDYAFRQTPLSARPDRSDGASAESTTARSDAPSALPLGTSVAGVVGGAVTLLVISWLGFVFRKWPRAV